MYSNTPVFPYIYLQLVPVKVQLMRRIQTAVILVSKSLFYDFQYG